MKTLGEWREMVRNQAGGAQVSTLYGPIDLSNAIDWAVRDFIQLAVELKSNRLLQHDDQDALASKVDYQIPPNFLSIYGVSAVASDGTETPYNPVNFHARAHANTDYFGAYEGYWVEHRTLHLQPAPSAFAARGVRIYGWLMPPMPLRTEVPVAVPPESERYIVACAVARHLLPPPPQQFVDMATRHLSAAQDSVEKWLRMSVRDVNPASTIEGGGDP